jgi:hypothetical protein
MLNALPVGGQDFRLELLFYHRELQSLIAIELEVVGHGTERQFEILGLSDWGFAPRQSTRITSGRKSSTAIRRTNTGCGTLGTLIDVKA